jgi:hypothetical protein
MSERLTKPTANGNNVPEEDLSENFAVPADFQ